MRLSLKTYLCVLWAWKGFGNELVLDVETQFDIDIILYDFAILLGWNNGNDFMKNIILASKGYIYISSIKNGSFSYMHV